MGSPHPSPNVKTFCNFEPQFWPEIITSRDAESTCSKGSRTSCDVKMFGIFWPNFGRKRSHHVMDASCRGNAPTLRTKKTQPAKIGGQVSGPLPDREKHCKNSGFEGRRCIFRKRALFAGALFAGSGRLWNMVLFPANTGQDGPFWPCRRPILVHPCS